MVLLDAIAARLVVSLGGCLETKHSPSPSTESHPCSGTVRRGFYHAAYGTVELRQRMERHSGQRTGFRTNEAMMLTVILVCVRRPSALLRRLAFLTGTEH